MKGYTYVHNCLFDWYYEHEEKDMTEADLKRIQIQKIYLN